MIPPLFNPFCLSRFSGPAEFVRSFPMLRTCLLITCVLTAAILIGCSKTESENSNMAAGNANRATTSTTPATKTTTTTSGEKIGVAECDDFIAKYESCVSSKVPEMARAQFQSAVKQWRESWKKLAANPQTKGTLAAACKQAAAQQEAALKQYGCAW
jgi:hypothetical protein